MLYLYFVWLIFLFYYDATLTSVILSKLHNFTSWYNRVIYIYIYVIYFVMQNSVGMTILLLIAFLQREIFYCYLVRKTDELDYPWCLCSYGDILGV